MKTVDIEVKNSIRKDYTVNAQPRLVIEWNFNRYVGTSADNVPAEQTNGIDITQFPIESLYAPNRPTRGVAKARVNEGRVSQYTANPQDTRYYVASETDQYKYWCSPVKTDGSKLFPTAASQGVVGDTTSAVKPHVSYDVVVSVNKIVVNWENSWASPDQYFIDIQTTVGGAWNTLSTNSWTLNSKGQTIIYHQGSDVWTTTRPVGFDGKLITNFKNLAGVRVRVNSLKAGAGTHTGTGANSFCNIIEISARREEDFTSRLITVTDQFDMGEKSNIYPMGTITSNTATVTLNNLDGVLSKESASTYLRWLVEVGATFNLEYVYEIAGTHYAVQQFKMQGGAWAGQRDDTVTIELTDDSKILKEVKPNACFYEGLPVTQIIWRLLDSVGYVNYAIQANDLVANHVISYFWTDGTKTIWEIFDDLSKATQTAIYFDAYGVLQVKTREAGFDSAASPVWTLRGNAAGIELADIVTLDQSDELEANYVTINYQDTKVSDFNNGMPKLDKVWEATDTVTLRSSQIVRTITNTETYVLYINATEAVYWPYQGVIQIEGEFIRYKAKNYIYYVGGVRYGANIKSEAEKAIMDAKGNDSDRLKNGFSGGLIIDDQSIDDSDPGYPGRGVWNSVRATHLVDMTGYSARVWFGTGSSTATTGYYYQDKGASCMVLQTNSRFKHWYDLMVVTHGSVNDAPYRYYGTKFKFEPAGGTTQRAGMVIHSSNNEDGYYVEFTPTSKITAAGRNTGNELIFYSRKGNVIKQFGNTNGVGIPMVIAEGVWVELDLAFQIVDGFHVISIFVNGVNQMTVTVPGAWGVTGNGRFGVHTRGQTKASFEYLYGLNYGEVQPTDEGGWYDRVNGGYQGGQWDREYVYQWKTMVKKIGKTYQFVRSEFAQQFFDEFGAICHEVREMDVKFDPKPVLHSQLYLTNDWQAICPEYVSTPFGAKFLLANASRDNAVIHGEDNLSFPGSSVNQVLAIYGRVITQAEAAQVVAKSDSQIQRRGRIEAEIASQWIQTKAAADDLSAWILNHWAEAADELTVEVFGNPMFEIGDVVSVDYAEKNMSPSTHKYFIVAVSTTFDEGITTSLTLRRVRG
jgi:hypothetical protein